MIHYFQFKYNILKSVKIAIDSGLLEEIEKYCSFAKLESKDDFLSEAAKYILERDKDWKNYKKLSNK